MTNQRIWECKAWLMSFKMGFILNYWSSRYILFLGLKHSIGRFVAFSLNPPDFLVIMILLYSSPHCNLQFWWLWSTWNTFFGQAFVERRTTWNCWSAKFSTTGFVIGCFFYLFFSGLHEIKEIKQSYYWDELYFVPARMQ